ncbi:MAG: hypothetical protein K8S94_11320 [Planctomycetia bacterium]|nr:hypothetical protein [Planctomycetia bacterium]
MSGDAKPVSGIDDRLAALVRGDWLPFVPSRFREPVARAALQVAIAAVVLFTIAPLADSKGEAWMEASFARTLAALAATRGLDSGISLAQSSEVSFSFGPGGSIGIGQALDPINDLVEQYGALLLTSTTALGVQRLGMQIAKTLGAWLFLPALVALGLSALCGPSGQRSLAAWSRRLFGLALFARLALPAAGWIDSLVADRFLEPSYQQASAAVAETTEKIERAEADDAGRPWYERYNPVDAIGDRARKLYESLAAVGESIVNLAIYFTISTIILPLGTLWLLSRLTGAFFSSRSDR